ncbi:MAG TPA: hypothetical protein VF719_05560 [Abditibacteriaceae bacterium]|jgi:hypothetical protein
MFELFLIIGATVAMSRLAEEDRGEGFKWGAITFGLCFASFIIPLPFLRVLLACVLSFILMTVMNKNN